MKKSLLFLAIVLAYSSAIVAQSGWTVVNSNLDAGTGVGQISVGMNNTSALWAYGIDATGAILDVYTKSTDGGLTWTKGTFNAGTGLSQLFAIDENTCWAVFNTGATQGLYKTVNGGTTWVKKGTAFGGSSFADVMHFFNNLDGFAMGDPIGGYFEIYTTIDGGETWTRIPQANIPAPTSGEYGITGNYCAAGNHVWFGTNGGRVFHSIDKGIHWTASVTAYGATETVSPAFADSLHGFAYRSYLNIGIEPTINITSDGGATWISHDVLGTWYARYIYYIPGTVGTYVGSSSDPTAGNGISYTYDGGYNWTPFNEGSDFQATAWLDEATGWAGNIATSKKSTGGMLIYTGDSLVPMAADFTADVTGIALGQSVHFTSLSKGFPTFYSWSFEGGTPPTSTSKDPVPITYNTSGSFKVRLIVSTVFGADTLTRLNYINVGGVGLNERSKASISVYPNPVSDHMLVKSSAEFQEVKVFNTVGQVVISEELSCKEVTLNTSRLRAGVYNLRVKFADGYSNIKFIVN